MKVVLVDNFDSFTLNIAQYLYEVTGTRPLVLPNTVPYGDLPLGDAEAVVLSPGPGRPSRDADFGVCRDVVARCELPLLGVCLGHQGIAEHFGARTVHAPEPAHGIVDPVKHTGTGLFSGLPQDLPVVRYHSLVITDLPDDLECSAWTGDGLVMAIAHRSRPIWGVQFHPESIATRGGHQILTNFVTMAAEVRPTGGTSSRASQSAADAVESSAVVCAWRRVGGAVRLRLEVRQIDQPDAPMDVLRTRFAGQRHAFWLDSEGSEQPGSRYSLMGAWAGEGSVVFSYELAIRRLTLIGEGRSEQVTGDLFELLEQVMSAVDVETPADWPLPFRGGLVGYFGYELKALTVGDERHRPHEPESWFLHTREFVVFDHHTGVALDCRLVAVNDGRNTDGRDAPEPTDTRRASCAVDTTVAFAPGPVAEPRLDLRKSHDEYLSMIKEAQRLIVEGETYEVCLTNKARLADVHDGLLAYGYMRSISPVPYGAYLRCGDLEVLSSSPERFLRIDESRAIESRPIKGTRPRGRSTVEDQILRQELLNSKKDQAENLMIVDLVRHDLNAVCEPGSVHVPDVFVVESYSSVHQLVSTIRGRLRWGESPLSAVRACFPGGSMTGAPKKRTMEIIDELEGTSRGIYSGALGWLSFSGAVDLSIVIRTAVVQGGSATFGVGGAITAKSDPEEEFVETLVKASVPYFGLRGWRERTH